MLSLPVSAGAGLVEAWVRGSAAALGESVVCADGVSSVPGGGITMTDLQAGHGISRPTHSLEA